MSVIAPVSALEDRRLLLHQRPARLQAGALHYFRLPHPALWRPALDALRAAGCNAVAVPIPWSYHCPAPGFYDFTGPRDLPRLLVDIEQAGLWLIAQPGPWLAAEWDGGGLPAWLPPASVPVAQNPTGDLHALRAWWEQLLPLLAARPNLALTVVDAGAGTAAPLMALARELGLPGVILDARGEDWARLGADWRDGPAPLAAAPAALGVELRSGPLPVLGGPSPARLQRALDSTHPRRWLASALGAPVSVLTPFTHSITWGRWGVPEGLPQHGLSAPLGAGLTPTPAYYAARRFALTAETLGAVLVNAAPVANVIASAPEMLAAAFSDGVTTLVCLDGGAQGARAAQVSLPQGDAVLTTAPLDIPPGDMRLLPLNWPLAGGRLLYANLEPLLRVAIAGRLLLLLVNPAGGELLLSDDFRPRHTRGAVHTQRTARGLRVQFEAERLISLLLDGPEGAVQLLALEPALAERVWPLDDTWRVTPAYLAAWTPAPADPARGLLIGPELVTPEREGCTYWVSAKGYGYRWGPWRGSDPHTWLSPVYWNGPAAPALPALGPWEQRAAAAELAPDYPDGGWTRISESANQREGEKAGEREDNPDDSPFAIRHSQIRHSPFADSPLAMEHHNIPRGFAWYRGRFAGMPEAVTLTCRHACDLFLNGELLAVLDAPSTAAPTPKTIPLPARLLCEENVLVVLAENLGRAADPELVGELHGLLACALSDGTQISWRIRGGLSGETSQQGVAGFADWRLVPDGVSAHLLWQRTVARLNLPRDTVFPVYLALERAPAKTYVYLNGWLIGWTWETRGVTARLWLPDGLLHRQGENELLLLQWTRGSEPGIGRAWLEAGPCYQRHREAGW